MCMVNTQPININVNQVTCRRTLLTGNGGSMVTNSLQLVTKHSPLYGSVKHTWYGMQQRVSYEVQPTNNQDHVNRCQEGTKILESNKICNKTRELQSCPLVCYHIVETFPTINYGMVIQRKGVFQPSQEDIMILLGARKTFYCCLWWQRRCLT